MAKTTLVQIRMTPAEKKAAEAKARAKGLSLSAWLRMLAVTATALTIMTGCGPVDSNDGPDTSGMWSSASGVLSCASATPFDWPGDPEAKACRWNCVNVDGVTYSEALLSFRKTDSDPEWRLESRFFATGECH